MSRSRSRSHSRRRPSRPSPRRRQSPPRGGGGGGNGGGGTIWVGGLPSDIKEDEIFEKFEKYGKVADVRLKISNRGPPFGFVEFANQRDAEDAVQGLDQTSAFSSGKIAVQHSGPKRPLGGGGGRRDSRARGGYGRRDSRRRGRDDYRDRRPKDDGANNYKITLENIPDDMTWTELKELGKQQVERPSEVTFARTYRGREGVACGILEFRTKSIAEDVVEKLDNRKIKNYDMIRVRMGDAREHR
ncbi:unnamed protein product [Amoebophrya sp. A25]|nr:unnamed protein product [Amoebophrya sp. A25]|eukprot:GSA25T00000795001.1